MSEGAMLGSTVPLSKTAIRVLESAADPHLIVVSHHKAKRHGDRMTRTAIRRADFADSGERVHWLVMRTLIERRLIEPNPVSRETTTYTITEAGREALNQ